MCSGHQLTVWISLLVFITIIPCVLELLFLLTVGIVNEFMYTDLGGSLENDMLGYITIFVFL